MGEQVYEWREVGDLTARRHADGTVEVLEADDVIAIDPDLLRQADPRWMRVEGDGDLVTICGTHRYRHSGGVNWSGRHFPVYTREPTP